MSTWHGCSIRTRLSVVAGAVMALICTVVAVFALLAVREASVEDRTKRLVTHAVEMARQIRQSGVFPRMLSDGHNEAVQVFDPAGTLVAATSGFGSREPPIAILRPDVDSYAVALLCDLHAFPGQCKIVISYPFHRADGVWLLNMAVADVPWYVGPRLLILLATGWLLLVGATMAGTYRTVSKTLEPVGAISGKLAQITASDFGHRVPVPKYRDELRDLAEIANKTLDRAQSAVEQQLRFASDASHDLRNPLAAMRVQIDEALMYPQETNWPQTANALLDSVERLQDLVTDLLQIARLDAGISGRHDPIDLTGLVAAEVDRRPRRVAVIRHLTPGVMINGERIGLARLLNNLLDNAERHSDSAITVTVTLESGTAVLEVCDDGEGIAPDQQEVIFQRFARLEASRRKDSGGTGLGLPIARQIAETHGGTLTIEDSPRGARFVLRLPAPR
ncbi:HAMP domain-containing histidine kinase [Streptosporangium sp. NBC_01755]|uniref:sensor histidine kinase n=1 Tax=unclassified Streptosporangium TaxID=2632669 RepID=UPI002DD8BC73|nr:MULTISPECIES: HAMP domain-containing sensor histidine kinase [unclassified Streptosporangium]WSA28540.1 HAMP domain-containing histidine kinase [Streptosporangium sp. NBC_01810]WSC99970.1 HAMP domain-containing histidine kinase [Streptosporangium sp. NBC_01755]